MAKKKCGSRLIIQNRVHKELWQWNNVLRYYQFVWNVVNRTACDGLIYAIDFDKILFPKNTLSHECDLYVSLAVLRLEKEINVKTGKLVIGHEFINLP